MKKKKSFEFLNKLKLIDISNNLGDSKTLITHPYTTTHKLEQKEKMSLRITENLIRLSVGLEDVTDIISDIDNALKNQIRLFKNEKNKVLINVEPIYLEDHSDPSEDSYLWAYKVKKKQWIRNYKVIKQTLEDFDSNGSHREVRGKGVVGEQPTIEPGHEFEYTSGTPLKTSSGIMHGSYQMQDFKGRMFEVLIPPFSLDILIKKKDLIEMDNLNPLYML